MATPNNAKAKLDPPKKLISGLITKEQTRPLLLFLDEASLLPTDEEGYRLEIGVTKDQFTEIKNEPSLEVSKIIETQRKIRDHCSDFNTKEYPKMVNLASLLKDYADKVGPPIDTSFYAVLVDQAKARDAALKAITADGVEATEKTKQQGIVDDATDNIQGLLDSLLDDARTLLKESDDVVAKLKAFQDLCKADAKDLNQEQQKTKDALTGEAGLLKNVEAELTVLHNQWHEAYVKFCVATAAAATSFLWLGLPVIGPIIFPIAAGVGGAEAKELHDQMDRIDTKIGQDDAKVAQYKKLMFNVGLVANKIDHLSQIIEPAIVVIQDFMGVWTAIVADLTAVQKTLSKDAKATEEGKKLTEVLMHLDVGILTKKWEDVGARADAFRVAAFITDGKPNPENKTFAEVRALIKAHYPS